MVECGCWASPKSSTYRRSGLPLPTPDRRRRSMLECARPSLYPWCRPRRRRAVLELPRPSSSSTLASGWCEPQRRTAPRRRSRRPCSARYWTARASRRRMRTSRRPLWSPHQTRSRRAGSLRRCPRRIRRRPTRGRLLIHPNRPRTLTRSSPANWLVPWRVKEPPVCTRVEITPSSRCGHGDDVARGRSRVDGVGRPQEI